MKKLLIIEVAALGYDFLVRRLGRPEWRSLHFHPMETVFPALTCAAQAGFRTATAASAHGMVGNGFFHRELGRPLFWEQSAALVSGQRIWDAFRAGGKRVAMLFWQQSLGEGVDFLLSPAPIHKHHGGMIQDCYSKPTDLYHRLRDAVGSRFDLSRYWGPRASAKSSDWIAAATCALLRDPEMAPDLCLTYLPALDYDLQRHGPDSPQAAEAFAALTQELDDLLSSAESEGYETVIFGDYAIAPVNKGAVLPNLALKRAGFFKTRNVKGMTYPDFCESRAFAVVDHEIAHVYVPDRNALRDLAECLGRLEGVGDILDEPRQREAGIAHNRSGDLVLTADDGHWFSYQYWTEAREAPDYAAHVDIHGKPGYDPCELFWGRRPFTVSLDHGKIRGSHGKTGGGRRAACWASTRSLPKNPTTLIELSEAARSCLGEGSRSRLEI